MTLEVLVVLPSESLEIFVLKQERHNRNQQGKPGGINIVWLAWTSL